MKSSDHDPFDEFADVIERLRTERPTATPLELDHIKTTAMARAQRRQASPAARRGSMRRTLVIAMVTGSLMIGGTGAVLAGGDNKGNDDSSKGQYGCPPGTHGSQCKPKTCKAGSGAGNDQGKGCKPPKGSHNSHPNGGSHNGGSHHSG